VDDLSPELREETDDGATERSADPPARTGSKRPADARAPDREPDARDRPAPARPLAAAVAELEARMIRDALAREGSLMGAARALDIDRNTLKRKLRALGLR